MATTIDAVYFQNILNDSNITPTKAEIIIDQSINMLNTYGVGLSNLTGVAGTKTGSYPSAQAGAIMTMTRETYAVLYKHAPDNSSGNLGAAGASYGSNNRLLDFAKELAGQLKLVDAISDTAPPIYVYNDPL